MMGRAPAIHRARSLPLGLRLTDEFVFIELADSRLIGIPFYVVPWLKAATDEQRNDYRLDPLSIY